MDYCNKKINFLHSKKSIKITTKLPTTSSNPTCQVYLCTDLAIPNKTYCLKIITARCDDKNHNSSINIEIVLLLSLASDPNIIHIIDYYSMTSQNNNVYFILMEYANKGTLYDLLKKNYNDKVLLNESQIYKIIYHISHGLLSIHKNKYAHRDLIPENILLLSNDSNNNVNTFEYKICDFSSSSNKYYDVTNHFNKQEIIQDVTKCTNALYRAPEQYQLYKMFPINIQVDCYALGIILFMLYFNYMPCNNKYYCINNNNNFNLDNLFFLIYNENNYSKKIYNLVNNEMKKIINPYYYELLKHLLQPNPKERYTSTDVIAFLDKYKSELNVINNSSKNIDERLSFIPQVYKLIHTVSNGIHPENFSTRQMILNIIISNNIQTCTHLVTKLAREKHKLKLFYFHISNTPIFYFTFSALKSLYLIHYIIINSEQDILISKSHTINIDELLYLLSAVYTYKLSGNFYDKADPIKNISVIKFIVSYCEFLKTKIGFNRKYKLLIENNNALISNDYNNILSKSFLEDCLCLLIQCYQLIITIPFNGGIILSSFDQIASVLNKEICCLFNLIYFIFIACGFMNKDIGGLEKQFMLICYKIVDYLDKLRRFRINKRSGIKVNELCDNVKAAFEFLEKIRNGNVNKKGFNLKEHFSLRKSYCGIQLNKNISNVFYDVQLNSNCSSDSVFKFRDDFGGNNNNNNTIQCKLQELQSSNNSNVSYNSKGNVGCNLIDDLINDVSNCSLDGDVITNHNNNSNNNNNSQVNFVSNTSNVSNSNVMDMINDIFNSSNQSNKNNVNVNSNDVFDFTSNNNNQLFTNSSIHQQQQQGFIPQIENKNNNNNFNFDLYGNMSNTFQTASNYSTPNQFQDMSSSFNQQHKPQEHSNTNITNNNNNTNNQFWIDFFPQTNINMNINNINNYNNSNIYNNQFFNETNNNINNNINNYNNNFFQNKNTPQTSNNIINTNSNNNNQRSPNNNYNNINIINIGENYNLSNVVNNITQVTKIANQFLRAEFCKPNFQFLISSKDIPLGKNIGFGGSSEVFIGNYRGTEVAVKRLKILELNSENLKEFKREVSSLSILRHPNLVIFMGAIAEPSNICIVTEYCAGGTLFNILHQKRELKLSWELRLKILLEIATGMNFLHTNNPPIIHRDLKSLNILLTDKIEKPTDLTSVKISDFGLSKIINRLDSSKEAMTGQLGTSHWMAPEVIRNTNYSNKADVYSYGIIIWEICTRITPYNDMNPQQISFYVTVNKGRPDKNVIPGNAPLELIKLMEMCWDDNPDNRPSFEEIIVYMKRIKNNYNSY